MLLLLLSLLLSLYRYSFIILKPLKILLYCLIHFFTEIKKYNY